MSTQWWGRRPDPIPPSRELMACLALSGLAVLALTPLATQGIVVFVRSGDFAWPPDPVAALAGIAHGDYGVGLPHAQARHLPAATELSILTVLAEVIALTSLVWLAALLAGGTSGLGTASTGGLGTAREARAVLGHSALRRRTAVVRPDLRRDIQRRRSGETTW